MLAVNSDRYNTPVQGRDNQGNVIWKLEVRDGSHNGTMIAHAFTYTFVEGPFKASFIYNRTSVKPNPRTLRVYGADALKDFVSRLSTNYSSNNRICLGQLAHKSKLQVHNDFEDWAVSPDGVNSSWWEVNNPNYQ